MDISSNLPAFPDRVSGKRENPGVAIANEISGLLGNDSVMNKLTKAVYAYIESTPGLQGKKDKGGTGSSIIGFGSTQKK